MNVCPHGRPADDRFETLVDLARATWPTVDRARVRAAVRTVVDMHGIDATWNRWSFELFEETAAAVARTRA